MRGRKLKNHKFYRQYSLNRYIVDFFCPQLKLVIEIDGNQHHTLDGIKYDKIREEFMYSLGITTMRFDNWEILKKIEKVVNRIENKLCFLQNKKHTIE